MAEKTVSKLFPDKTDLDTDSKLVSHIQANMFEPAKREREKLDFRWYVYLAWRDGKQWLQFNKISKRLEEPPSAVWRERPVINEVFIAARANNAVLTANRPRFEVVPSKVDSIMDPETGKIVEGDAIKFARKSGKYLDYLFYKLKGERKIYELVDDGFMFGNGIIKVNWDVDADNGLGEVSWDRVSPFNFYPDPAGIDPDHADHRFIDYVVPKDTKTLMQRYKLTPSEIKSDGKLSLSSYASMFKQSRTNGTGMLDDITLTHETWIRDPYVEKLEAAKDTSVDHQMPLTMPDGSPVFDDMGLPVVNEVQREVDQGEALEIIKYKMKVVTWVPGIILKERVDPLKDGEYPFVHYTHEIVPGEYWGDSGVKHVVDLNRNLNRRVAQALENANKNNNPRIVIDEGAGIKKGGIPTAPGGVLRVRRGTKVDVIPGMNIARDSWDLTAYFDGKIQDLTATHDASRGRIPQGVTSGRQVELMQSADATILSPKVQELEGFMSKLGQKSLRRIADFYPVGKQGVVLNSTGAPEEVDIEPQNIDSTNVRVRIVSFLSMTKAARREELDKLLQMGAIDQQTYLEYYEFPDPTAIVERTKMAKEEAARLAAISGGQNGGSTPDMNIAGLPQAPQSGQTGVPSVPAVSQIV